MAISPRFTGQSNPWCERENHSEIAGRKDATMPEQRLHQGCSYADLICRAIQCCPDHTALIDDDGEFTYRALGGRVSQYAKFLPTLG
jgi:non-ribosomal peptide synthetase component E (peptide arylation enzyme)